MKISYEHAIKCSALFLVSALLVLVDGCESMTNGFTRFYQDKAGAAITNLPPYSGTTKIITTSDPKNDATGLYRDNYALIGESAFQGPPTSEWGLKYQAKMVGADVVLVSSAYLGSQQTEMPYIQYQPGQVYTTSSSGTVNANIYGSGGYAYGTGNYYGTSTTTTPGTLSTEMMPVTIQRYSYNAGYFRKMKPPILGVVVQPLPPDAREKLQQNTGVICSVVINDSPAFLANLLEGDIILKMNGEDVISKSDYSEKLLGFAGKKIDLGIWRNGENKTISVLLNNAP